MSKTNSPKPIHQNRRVERNIFIAFILNLVFSIYEFIGGAFTHSVAITSDAIHDIGDALSIGLSYILERKSHRGSDKHYTYGYIRYSLVGGLITATILFVGSLLVIVSAVGRIINPVEINYNGMIVLAIIGVIVNFFAAYFTREGDSLNQKSVNLHMLEDVLGWAVVLVGAIIMRFTNFSLIDPILSIFVACFILKETIKNLIAILDVLLEKTPRDLDLDKLRQQLLEIKAVKDVHHLHAWSMDGYHNCATLHIVSDSKQTDFAKIKSAAREVLDHANIAHSTIEIENPAEQCSAKNCAWPDIDSNSAISHHHHHH